MSNLNIRVDNDIKKLAEDLFKELGMNTSSAVNIFLRQAIREGGIPFKITSDPFYGKNNTKALIESKEQIENGEVVEVSIDNL